MAKPKLRFPGFTDEWEESLFCNLATISGGYAFDSKKMMTTSAKYQIVKMGNLYKGNLDLEKTPSFIEEVTEKELEYLIQTDDIGITLTGTVNKHDYGYSYRFSSGNKNLLMNQRLGLIRAKKNINAVFLSFIVKGENFLTQFYSISTGGTGNQTNVSTRGIEKIVVAIPTYKEQQKIADFLSFVDDIIQVQEEEIIVFEEQKKGVMQKLINRELRFKTDDGSEYPEWEEKQIDEICQIIGGGTPNTSNGEFWNGHIQWFTPAEVGKSKYVYTSERAITEKGIQCSSAKLLPKGAILLSTRATIGEMSIAGQECCTNQGFQSLIVNENCSNEFIYYLQDTIKAYALKNSSGSTFLEISKSNLGKCILPIPCINEQEKIVNCLSAYDEIIQIKKDKLGVWKEIKKGLLQQMFV